MKNEYLTELNEQELIQKVKKIRANKIIDATIVGVTIGIAIYSAVKNGFGFSTFFSILLVYLIIRNSKTNNILEKEVEKELNSRSPK